MLQDVLIYESYAYLWCSDVFVLTGEIFMM
uniref:Uncharacterized protein n=1 Tax=Arundo donax TaxID=35708 RepID=A0A0A9GUN6_ARUDO